MRRGCAACLVARSCRFADPQRRRHGLGTQPVCAAAAGRQGSQDRLYPPLPHCGYARHARNGSGARPGRGRPRCRRMRIAIAQRFRTGQPGDPAVRRRGVPCGQSARPARVVQPPHPQCAASRALRQRHRLPAHAVCAGDAERRGRGAVRALRCADLREQHDPGLRDRRRRLDRYHLHAAGAQRVQFERSSSAGNDGRFVVRRLALVSAIRVPAR